MILLDSTQTLSAVRRSLETHVLGVLDDSFARLQVLAAMKALDDVIDRLQRGDPIDRANERVEAGLRSLADSVRGESPGFAESIDSLLSSAASVDQPRDRARVLGEGNTELIRRHDPASRRLVDFLNGEAATVTLEDSTWMCQEAIESLQ